MYLHNCDFSTQQLHTKILPFSRYIHPRKQKIYLKYDPQNNIHPSLFLFHSHSSSAPLISYIEMIQTRYSP